MSCRVPHQIVSVPKKTTNTEKIQQQATEMINHGRCVEFEDKSSALTTSNHD